jgi:hypothetical protein
MACGRSHKLCPKPCQAALPVAESHTPTTTLRSLAGPHQVIAAHLPPDEVEGVRQMFQDMDTDGSGTISFEELRNGEGGGAWGRGAQGAQCEGRRRGKGAPHLQVRL